MQPLTLDIKHKESLHLKKIYIFKKLFLEFKQSLSSWIQFIPVQPNLRINLRSNI